MTSMSEDVALLMDHLGHQRYGVVGEDVSSAREPSHRARHEECRKSAWEVTVTDARCGRSRLFAISISEWDSGERQSRTSSRHVTRIVSRSSFTKK